MKKTSTCFLWYMLLAGLIWNISGEKWTFGSVQELFCWVYINLTSPIMSRVWPNQVYFGDSWHHEFTYVEITRQQTNFNLYLTNHWWSDTENMLLSKSSAAEIPLKEWMGCDRFQQLCTSTMHCVGIEESKIYIWRLWRAFDDTFWYHMHVQCTNSTIARASLCMVHHYHHKYTDQCFEHKHVSHKL